MITLDTYFGLFSSVQFSSVSQSCPTLVLSSFQFSRSVMSYSAAAAAAAKSLQSCPTLCDPTDGSPPGSPVYFLLILWVQVHYISCSGPTSVRSDFSLPTMFLLFSVLTTLAFVVSSPHPCACHTPRSEPFLVMLPLPP